MNAKGMSQTQKLRELMKQDGLVVGAGAHDTMTAHIVEHVGFPVCFVTGAGISMTRGYADYGLMSMAEVISSCRNTTRPSSCHPTARHRSMPTEALSSTCRVKTFLPPMNADL